MPLINYVALRELVEELDALAGDTAPDASARRRREDALYTVCVYTGVRDPRRALTRARRLLAARPSDTVPTGAAPAAAAAPGAAVPAAVLPVAAAGSGGGRPAVAPVPVGAA
ncbi:DUF5133 domain-containing protein [Kitasatospora sp. NPDC059571]|uniref:DUF5133 domain-containing protein n=1 Tax=Kitasatospora sp. NPDC059571 TaxID=3346871 RepID=UPI003673F793